MAVSAAQSSPPLVPEDHSWTETDFSTIKVTHIWTIHKLDFYVNTITSSSSGTRYELEGQTFSSQQPGDDLVWRLGASLHMWDSRSISMALKLVLVSGTTEGSGISTHIKASVLESNQKKMLTQQSRFNLYKVGEDCPLHYFSGDGNKLISHWLSDGNLTLLCEIQIQRTDKPQITTGKKLALHPQLFDTSDLSHLSQDFGSLLESGLFSDVTIMAGGKEFKVHKNILSTRSPVFRAMFDHGMQESVQNRVTIDDLSPEVVQEMLTFIYTGQSPNLKKMPGDLLRAADKYDLKQLKARGERELADRVSPENLVDTLLIADQHSATELREVCMKLFTTHAEEVVKTEGWSKLIQSGHQLITELFVRMAKK